MVSTLPYGLEKEEFETALAHANAQHTQPIDLETLIALMDHISETEAKYNMSFARAREQRLKASVENMAQRRTCRTALNELHECTLKPPREIPEQVRAIMEFEARLGSAARPPAGLTPRALSF
ncbi:MAG: hypothetical protein JWN90_697 [Parcubacteria group bacterium]|nr:hypothetical protein [Parcubacteria group bacterium]